MKKILLVLSLLLLIFALASCAKEQIDLSSYQIVIPDNATATEKYSAENLSKLINDKFNISVSVVSDTAPEKENEILIGETNRKESKTNTSLSKMQFLVFKSNSKIVLKGDGIYIGSACSDLANEYLISDGKQLYVKNLSNSEKIYSYQAPEKCESVIFMIGDGMGENHIKLGENLHNFSFAAKQFPNIGWSITRSQSVINGEASYTDSAASGTAMSTGYKTINDYIGVDKNGNRVLNVRELAFSMNAKTAVLTTDKITGATPSAYLCHNISRENTEELQAEIDALVSENKIDYCKGSVDDELLNETKNALTLVSKDNSKFFIMIEEGYIDKHSHNKDLTNAAYTVARFNEAIEYATQFALMHPNVALIVTADHETGNLKKSSVHKEGFTFKSFNHTNQNTPIFALGAGTEIFNEKTVENIELAKFTAKVYSNEPFGMNTSELSPVTAKVAYTGYFERIKRKIA